MDKLREIWKEVTQIEIGQIQKVAGKKDIFNALNTCYKKELFTQNGWCFTTDGIRSKRWGFCDSSCKLMKERDTGSDTTPHKYHRMIWEIDIEQPDKCIKDLYGSYDKAWFACVKPLIPTVTVPQFTIGDNKELTYYGNNQEKPEDYAKSVEFGYQQPCAGDSGSGNWIWDTLKTDPNKEKRATLVGVVKGSATLDYWCSEPSLMLKITWPQFHKWIKKHAGITKS